MPNQLSTETSPYLLQHAANPVAWFPWSDEALAEAKRRDCPIFLSIGYSACHWCHVMEHESFENEAIADYLNDHFVCIKVDREERPDLDQIYMTAVQLMTGRGGWPMSVFLTPDLKPFFGGTYWPPTASRGMAGFDQVIRAVDDAWINRREDALQQASMLTDRIEQVVAGDGGSSRSEDASSTLVSAAKKLESQFDFTNGGFGGAPKFPQPMSLNVLLRTWKQTDHSGLRDLVTLNLEKMADGGIYDHLGGGFARYSVDERWLVPHFEKMLYDNAQLVTIFVDAFKATGDPRYEETATETLDYVLRDMTDEQGGFYSAEDADSEGVEGKFYVWTPQEIKEALGNELAEQFCYVYDVSESGNFEHGTSILNLPKSWEAISRLKQWDTGELKQRMSHARQQLFAIRERRVRPGLDDKVLVSWNGLMIEAMARAGAAFDQPRFVKAATQAAEFIERELMDAEGKLQHSWRRVRARFVAYLDDYACLANGLIALYEASFDERWIKLAADLVDTMIERFAGHPSGRFYYTATDHEQLITRVCDLYDSATPSGNGMAATVLARLGHLLDRDNYTERARDIIRSGYEAMESSPLGVAQSLIALHLLEGPRSEYVVIGGQEEDRKQVLQHLRQQYLPNSLVLTRTSNSDGISALDHFFKDRPASEQVALYSCTNYTCRAPLYGLAAILSATTRQN